MKLLSRLAISFFFISIISFSVIRLIPGDPVQNLIGERGATEEQIENMRRNLGLDRSVIVQYGLFVGQALRGDFGESITSKQTVWSEFKVLFPATVELALMALLWAAVAGIFLGVMAAVRRNSFYDYAVVSLSTVGFAMPLFWWGLICIFTFAVHLGILPVSGRIDVIYDVPFVTGFFFFDTLVNGDGAGFVSALKHMVLPAFVLGTIPLALIVRVTRSSFIDIAKEDFIRTARAKGLAPGVILFKHVFRNALPQILTALGLSLGYLLTGAIMTETLFSWPGIGRWLVTGILARDYPVVQAGLFYSMIIVVLVNAATDLAIRVVNPRLRDDRT
jgi:dipeptide transport system permease protein